jgi:adenine-specific DNA-methyltransferase
MQERDGTSSTGVRERRIDMSNVDRQQTVLSILQGLNGLDGLKQLFWEELNYERENKPLSPRQWPESARQPLAEDPILFASGGAENAFHVVYCRLKSEALSRGDERPIVNRLTREHPYALFVFSNNDRTDWHFLNVKYDENAEKRRLLRRITVRSGEGLRTAAERLCMLDLVDGVDRVDGELTPLAIQSTHDDAFDVEKVTKDFYREIANWYFWALKHATFPKDAPKEKDGHDHISVIRLITRLIFCWFIREKGLIPDVIFDEKRLAEMLDGFAPGKVAQASSLRTQASIYYRAVLQNLFFATLNTEMDQRGWRRPGQNMMAHCLYRHKECFRDPKAGLEWFKDIPFLNGGLFECLDRDFGLPAVAPATAGSTTAGRSSKAGEGANPRYLRVDGFSDRDDSRPTVPDFLFFGAEQEIDLSDDYGDKKFKKVRVRGLIDTLNRYKFTIEENTPLDQEVALDPELCGKVFENLLAAYNPETGTTARKATGSFYTPREIVDYMVDESLVAYLRGRLVDGVDTVDAGKVDTVDPPSPKGSGAAGADKKLRALLAYDAEMPVFSEAETETLIDAIDRLKALDPAVGSGAFPMGMLHKLVHVLGKLDPGNERWKAKQIAKLDDVAMREDAERIFRDNYDDYGRKLYLIENCIYGVDIQPIAVQIAKMRFFISLIVDQKVNPKSPNLGVRALPNLETKFVAANTLIGIEKPEQMLLRNPDIDKKEAELRKVREKHFTARTLKSKAKCREDDKRLRAEIAELLKNDGWDNATAKQLAAWDPYDQNACSPFFDSEWMFGIVQGFDVSVGNPPYVSYYSRESASNPSIDDELQQLRKRFSFTQYNNRRGRINLWMFFAERFVNLLCDDGVATFLADVNLTKDLSRDIRRYLTEHTAIMQFVHDLSAFENVASGQVIMFVRRGRAPQDSTFIVKSSLHDHGVLRKQVEIVSPNYSFLVEVDDVVVSKLSEFTRLKQLDSIKLVTGVQVGGTEVYKGRIVKDHFYRDTWDHKSAFPSVSARSVTRYSHPTFVRGILFDYGLASEITKFTQKSAVVLQKYAQFLHVEKILIRQSATEIAATIASAGSCGEYSLFSLICEQDAFDLFYLLGLLNSKLLTYFALKTGVILCKKGTQPQIRKAGIERLPIATVSLSQQSGIARIVRGILQAKAADPAADTSALEREIDDLVYKLYGLTAEEIAIVEGASASAKATADKSREAAQGKGGGK